jgi:hypothetical protein
MWLLQNFSGITLFLRKQNSTITEATFPSKYSPFATMHFCQRLVKVLETFLEAIVWKPFQLFHPILNYVSSITKRTAPSMLVAVQGKGKNQLEPGQESTGLLQCCFVIIY